MRRIRGFPLLDLSASWGSFLYIIKKMNYFRNAMSKLYNAVSAPVAATRDALSRRLESIRDTVAFYYNKAKEQVAPHRTLQDEVEEVAMQDYVGVEDIKHMYGREKNGATDDGLEDTQYSSSVRNQFTNSQEYSQ